MRQLCKFLLAAIAILPLSAFSQIFITDSGNGRLMRSEFSDPAATNTAIVSFIAAPRGIAIDAQGQQVYWVSLQTNQIRRSALDGQNEGDFLTGLDTPRRLAFDPVNRNLYFSANAAGLRAILRVNVDFALAPLVIVSATPNGGPEFIAIDATRDALFWIDSRDNSIRRTNLAGQNEQTILSGSASTLGGITVDLETGKIYWANSSEQRIISADSNGGGRVIVLTDLTVRGPISIDTGTDPATLYYANPAAATISSVSINGGVATPVLDIQDGLAQPNDIVILPSAAPDGPDNDGTIAPGTTLDEPPVVSISGNDVTFTFEDFTTISLEQPAAARREPLRGAKAPTLRYELQVTGEKKSLNQKKISKRNTITIKNLKPGDYSAKYKATVYTKRTKKQREKAEEKGKEGFEASHKTEYKTSFSPSSSFSIN